MRSRSPNSPRASNGRATSIRGRARRRRPSERGAVADPLHCAPMKLHDFSRSSAAFRVRIALELKGLRPERAFRHLRKGEQRAPEFLKLNPMGLVPALEDGGRALTQSLAIIESLDQTHPTPPLLPKDPAGR